jgi:glycosyltransferase involved in cell wall biosynthesis
MEAAASSLPIVATDIRGCREVVASGDNGILVPKLDPVKLGVAIDFLVDNEGERLRMSRRARARAEAEFDETVVVRKVIDAYKDVADRKRLTKAKIALGRIPAAPANDGL